jgi:hypothetical protein
VSSERIQGAACRYYQLSTKNMLIDDGRSPNSQAARLCNEVARPLVRADRVEDDPELDYRSEKLVVESVACSLGINADPSSIPYLASWAERSDLKVIEQTAGLIDRRAKRIEAALAPPEDAQASPETEVEPVRLAARASDQAHRDGALSAASALWRVGWFRRMRQPTVPPPQVAISLGTRRIPDATRAVQTYGHAQPGSRGGTVRGTAISITLFMLVCGRTALMAHE